jgi:hypothetical protein
MKNFIRFGSISIVVLFIGLTGCNNVLTDLDPDPVQSAKVSVVVFDDGTLPSKSNFSRAVSYSDLKVSFRSSGVDFYQIGDFDNISNPVENSISFANEEETLIFVPGEVSVATRDSNPSFAEGTYDMIRLDAGRGEFTFNYQGSEVFVENSEDPDRNSWSNEYGTGEPVVDNDGNYIDIYGNTVDPNTYSGDFSDLETGDAFVKSGFNGNSIVLVDSSVLTEPVLVPRNELRNIADHPEYYLYDSDGDVWDWDPIDDLPGSTVINDTSSDYFNSLPSVVQDILLESRNEIDEQLSLFDIDGALFIPFDPQVIPADASRVTVEIEWTVVDSVVETENGYEMANRVEGTSFDFSVNLIVE